MSEGMDRNESNFAAKLALKTYGNYSLAYEEFFHHIRGRYECYMPGYEKKIAKKYKKYINR